MNPRIKKSIGIIGCGRFGALLSEMLSEEFEVSVYDVKPDPYLTHINFTDLESVLQLSTIFIAVPIHHFKNTIIKIASKLIKKTTVIDVCSVKCYPVEIMQAHLPPSVGIIATHPLFGPDSLQKAQLKMMMHPARDTHDCYEFWKNYFSSKKIKILEMTPDQHDRFSARSQSITHFIGRTLELMGSQSTEMDTIGYKNLLAVMAQTCNDKWDLFLDLKRFNPYAAQTIGEFIEKSIHLQKEITKLSPFPDASREQAKER
ncbi:prephenate dehydrogenase/arogenate dehydrogenase family protein [Coxiella burnetii]|uniref:Prephenate dehydrogenase n=1 Tax=Coxiella burnetii (strain RSA 493 / Nine Mile phase I) TaxID=227377 RepID=Q83CW8_COXBU|nr:prephenate dehydrogenase/arogenate dehydrogenase family protein [Coxiella burnetii]NP_819991.1 prephenate dehydrogenase [Coxiella burnetii RSA 493]AAO90505.1 prephenate dehydrogenase [Coxiella burnetii RSA 493]ARI65809.1 prephenate dehydrogenase [Coxiella burnetii]ARK27282.1 prephenate dehydrogenase [Coxiella burnetii]MCF2092792.1 prephenate dehydrogenase/arogenate dehydrogenase family protein [Coxiella burnetii]MCF2095012.1 prephenate dehydrogenase/arogenate dehydrogenase family protein [